MYRRAVFRSVFQRLPFSRLGLIVIMLGVIYPGNGYARTLGSSPVRIMPLGDEITEGGDGLLPYRYFLWHLLRDSGYSIDFVGTRHGLQNGNPGRPDFDQDHQASAEYDIRTVAEQAASWARQTQPDIVLTLLGRKEMEAGQSPAALLLDLGRMVDSLRLVRPEIVIVTAGLFGNSPAVTTFNAGLSELADSLTTSRSPVTFVDMSVVSHPGDFVSGQPYPSDSGSRKIAHRFFPAPASFLSGDSLRVVVFDPREGQSFGRGSAVPIRVRITGVDQVEAVEFYADSVLLGTDTIAPYEYRWTGPELPGRYGISAMVRGRSGRVSSSGPVRIRVFAGED